MPEKPRILATKQLAQTQIFQVEGLHLQFANGEQRDYERLVSRRGAVLVIPKADDETIWLVREYCAGVDDYQLGFPKGLIDAGEDKLQAAQRELQEEVGHGAKHIEFINTVTLAPAYMTHLTHIILAQDLYPQALVGDEPEPIEVVPWSLNNLDALVQREDFTDVRSIAALFYLQQR